MYVPMSYKFQPNGNHKFTYIRGDPDAD